MNDKLQITPRRPKGDDGYKTFSIRIKEDTVFELERIAALTGRSRNEVIGLLLEYAVQNCVIAPDSQQLSTRFCNFVVDICPWQKYNVKNQRKSVDGDSNHQPNAAASPGQCEPDASKPWRISLLSRRPSF